MGLASQHLFQRSFSGLIRLSVLASAVVLVSYVAFALVLTLAHEKSGAFALGSLAASPRSVATGSWWQLFTSALVFAGTVLPQVILVVALGLIVLRLTGTLVFWLIVLVGHVGSTLLVYLGIWAWSALRHVGSASLSAAPDYGLSLIWCALLGALVAIAWRALSSTRRRDRLRLVVSAGAIVLIAGMAIFSTPIARYEHILAICSGALVAVLAWRPPSSRRATTGTLGDHD